MEFPAVVIMLLTLLAAYFGLATFLVYRMVSGYWFERSQAIPVKKTDTRLAA